MTLDETNATKAAIAADLADTPAEIPPAKRQYRRRTKTTSAAVQPDVPPATPETPPPETPQPETLPRYSIGNVVLRCECGADIMPDENGLYPDYCPTCGTENDYRNVEFLRRSPDILVCDRCGKLTRMPADKCRYCGWDGS